MCVESRNGQKISWNSTQTYFKGLMIKEWMQVMDKWQHTIQRERRHLSKSSALNSSCTIHPLDYQAMNYALKACCSCRTCCLWSGGNELICSGVRLNTCCSNAFCCSSSPDICKGNITQNMSIQTPNTFRLRSWKGGISDIISFFEGKCLAKMWC